MEANPSAKVGQPTLRDRANRFVTATLFTGAIATPVSYMMEGLSKENPSLSRAAIWAGATALVGGVAGVAIPDGKPSAAEVPEAEETEIEADTGVFDTVDRPSVNIPIHVDAAPTNREGWPDIKTIVESNAPVMAYIDRKSVGRRSQKTRTDLTVFVENPNIAAFTAQLVQKQNGSAKLHAWNLNVDEEYREHRLATRLTSALVYTAIEQGATKLTCTAASPHTLKIFKRLFKEKKIRVLDLDDTTPLELQDAITRLEKDIDGYDSYDFSVKLPRKADRFEKPTWAFGPPLR